VRAICLRNVLGVAETGVCVSHRSSRRWREWRQRHLAVRRHLRAVDIRCQDWNLQDKHVRPPPAPSCHLLASALRPAVRSRSQTGAPTRRRAGEPCR